MSKKEDRYIANAATPGPWYFYHGANIGPSRDNPVLCGVPLEDAAQSLSNATFSAYYNPKKVGEMLDRIEELESENEAHFELLKQKKDQIEQLKVSVAKLERRMMFVSHTKQIVDSKTEKTGD